MYLINLKTYLLEEFFGEEIPKYAILSHTWGPSKDEIHFYDISSKDPRVLEKAGWKKIRYLCLQAAKDGLEWAWCDTCCIDKRSSAELSEAINSMFQWYRDSEVCYAYLSDVFDTGDEEDTKDQLSKSRWFTRGWTLQELLAPRKVHFYDRDWIFLGNKQKLCHQPTTRIDRRAIVWPTTLSGYSLGTRMSWAAGRKTTRVEDQAYCMLGILGVHMPLLYGEGTNAFRRLQEELVRTSDDETIFVHRGANILATSADEFTNELTLVPSKKTRSTPYSITNAGLQIEMRVLKYDAAEDDAPERSAIGILNCFEESYDYRIGTNRAVPLRNTGIENTYRKAYPAMTWGGENINEVPFSSITILLENPKVPALTLVEDYDREQLSAGYGVGGSSFIATEGRQLLHVLPSPPFERDAIVYHFRKLGESEYVAPITLITFFDHIYDRAGLLHIPGKYDDEVSEHAQKTGGDHESATFKDWVDRGRPTSAEVEFMTLDSRIVGSLKADVVRQEFENQLAWHLKVRSRGLETTTYLGQDLSFQGLSLHGSRISLSSPNWPVTDETDQRASSADGSETASSTMFQSRYEPADEGDLLHRGDTSTRAGHTSS